MGIDEKVQALREVGYVIGLGADDMVKVSFPGGQEQTQAGKDLLNELRQEKEAVREYLRDVFMPERKEEIMAIIYEMIERGQHPYPYEVEHDKDLLQAIGQRCVLNIYHGEPPPGEKNGISASTMADIWLMSTYDPKGVRQLFDAKRLFEGAIVNEQGPDNH